MPAVLYLLLSVFLGYIFIKVFTPYIFRHKNYYINFTRTTKHFPLLFVVFPASFSIGTVISGWLLYIPSYLLRETDTPLLYGCIISTAVMIFITAMYLVFKRSFIRDLCGLYKDFIDTIRQNLVLAFFFIAVFVFIYWLMTLTFYVKDGTIRMGVSVFSDFAVHTALIRSFSLGSNFPTQFPHFPDGTIRYHFMFQFFTGALEYMGLRIDIALNIMSITALSNAALLLYSVAVIVTNKRAAGILTVIFFLFRSSLTGLRYLKENLPFESIKQFFGLITGVNGFLGYTPHEDWGLWNMNVYANQRHFALGISLMLFGVIAMLPLMKKMLYVYEYRSMTFKERINQFFFTAGAWLPDKPARAVSLGVLFGASAFFHGSAVIAVLGMLAIMGIFSKHRLEFLIIAAITYVLSNFEAGFFAPGVEIGKPEVFIGFISPDRSFKGIMIYIFMLTGAALIIALIGLIIRFRRFKVFFLMFLTPLIITFTLSLTPDVTVNHKFLMISMALLNIFAAYAICVIMGSIPGKLIGAVLVALMVLTGVIDTFTIQNLNGNERSINIPQTSPYQEWLLKNTKPHDIFLTSWHGVNELYFTGRYEFFGWPYYAWSGGYDTDKRLSVFRQMLSPKSPETLKQMVIQNKISYIVLDSDIFEINDNGDYFADPDLFEILEKIYPLVYSDQDKRLFVFKTDYNP